MKMERQYFSEIDEWTNQERSFANCAIRDIGWTAWQNLLKLQREEGNDAFIQATNSIWPNGLPPGLH